MVGGIVSALSRRSRPDPFRRTLVFLATLGLTFWAIVAVDAFFNKVQPNWPAPAYFTLIILTAYFLSTRLESFSRWRRWRPWVYATVLLGVVVTPIVHDTALLYPLVPHIARLLHRPKFTVRNLDPTVKLKGYAKLGRYVSVHLNEMPRDAFVLAEDYQSASELAFYTAGQPKTYSAGSYTHNPKHRTQFDIWPDRDLAQPGLRGRDAIYVGDRRPEILGAFDSVERLADLTITPYALDLPADTFPDESHPDPTPPSLRMRSFPVWKCHNFHGLSKQSRATY
jgi:hypothetical protein